MSIEGRQRAIVNWAVFGILPGTVARLALDGLLITLRWAVCWRPVETTLTFAFFAGSAFTDWSFIQAAIVCGLVKEHDPL